MRSPLLARRLGLLGDSHEVRFTWLLVGLVLALYPLGYAAFYPRGATVDDESSYLEMTQLWVETGSFQIVCVKAAWPPNSVPVSTTGFSSARAA